MGKKSTTYEKMQFRFSKTTKDQPKYDPNFEYDIFLPYINSKSLQKIIQNHVFATWNQLFDHFLKVSSLGSSVTIEKMILLYGDNLGRSKWSSYCKKQSISNTFEYKQSKHGMTKEEYNEYNKSRATTKQNMIARYGYTEGTKRWSSYCDRQAYTNTKLYLGDRFDLVNAKKGHGLDAYILRNGGNEHEAKSQYIRYWTTKSGIHYSKKSQQVFWKIYNDLLDDAEKNKCHFAELNREYVVYDSINRNIKMYDFVCSCLFLCIEFHGDHYHGNPKIYRSSDTMRGRGQTKRTALESWKSDKQKEDLIVRERKYRYIIVWESDWDDLQEFMMHKIQKVIDEQRHLYG